MERKDMYIEESPKYKKPCNTCNYRQTQPKGPFCGKCIHADPESGADVPLDRLVMPRDRLIITKLEGMKDWSITSNPRWDDGTKAMNQMLRNAANDYAEKKNCGVIHRMIRLEDVEAYGLSVDEIKIGWILRRDEAEA